MKSSNETKRELVFRRYTSAQKVFNTKNKNTLNQYIICKHKQIQWAIGWKIIVFNLLVRPPEPDFIEASRLIAGLLVGKLAFDEVWCQGAAKFPSNYLLARAPQLFTFRTQHVDQTTSYNQRDEWIRRVVITVLNEWSYLVLP